MTWPAVAMGAFTLLNGSVLLPVVRSWSRNRNAGKTRDATIEALTSRLELAFKEVAGQVAANGQTVWDVKGDIKTLTARMNSAERLLERLQDREDRAPTGRPLP